MSATVVFSNGPRYTPLSTGKVEIRYDVNLSASPDATKTIDVKFAATGYTILEDIVAGTDTLSFSDATWSTPVTIVAVIDTLALPPVNLSDITTTIAATTTDPAYTPSAAITNNYASITTDNEKVIVTVDHTTIPGTIIYDPTITGVRIGHRTDSPFSQYVIVENPISDVNSIQQIALRDHSSGNGSVPDMKYVVTTKATNFQDLFSDIAGFSTKAATFNDDLSEWDTRAVTTMRRMFQGGAAFNNGGNSGIINWDTSLVGHTGDMFNGCTFFNQPIGNWDISSNISITRMFKDASAFNQDLNDWNFPLKAPGNSLNSVFENATSFNGNITSWDVSTLLFFNSTFAGATSFNQDISGWNPSKALQMNNMFDGASAFDKDISLWCLPGIVSKPTGFDAGSGFENQTEIQPRWDCYEAIITSDKSTLRIGETATITVTFTRDVSTDPIDGFTEGDIVSSLGGTFSNLTGVNLYTFTLTYTPPPNSVGTDTLTIAAGKAKDDYHNKFNGEATLNVTVITVNLPPPPVTTTPTSSSSGFSTTQLVAITTSFLAVFIIIAFLIF